MQDYQGASSLRGWRGMLSSRHSSWKQKDFIPVVSGNLQGRFPQSSLPPPGARLCFSFALPVPTSASQSNPVLGSSGSAKLTRDPLQHFGVTPVGSPWALSPVGLIQCRGLSCCPHRNPRGNWMRAPVSMRILNQSPSPNPGRHAWG